MRRFLLSGTLNTRDLGGYSIDYRKVTAYRVFVRSDVPLQISENDKKLLLYNNITTIVDLRSEYEVENKPCALKFDKDFQYYHCKIYGDGRLPDSVEDVSDSYFEMVDEQKSVLNVMKVFAKASGGVLYHCTAGKDRTGDYQISQVYLGPLLQQFCKSNKDVDINIITPKIEYMESFLDMFLRKYKSIEEYFAQIGLTEAEVLQLKTKLTSYAGCDQDSGLRCNSN